MREATWKRWTYQEYHDQVGGSDDWMISCGWMDWEWLVFGWSPPSSHSTHLPQHIRQSLLFARALMSMGFQPHGVINILGFNAVRNKYKGRRGAKECVLRVDDGCDAGRCGMDRRRPSSDF